MIRDGRSYEYCCEILKSSKIYTIDVIFDALLSTFNNVIAFKRRSQINSEVNLFGKMGTYFFVYVAAYHLNIGNQGSPEI